MISRTTSAKLSFATPSFPFRVTSASSVCSHRRLFPCTATLRGYSSIYSGDGQFIEEKAVSLSVPSNEASLISSAKPNSPQAASDNSSIVFHSGAISRGPSVLGIGNFSLDAILPTDGVHLAVRIKYDSGERKALEITLASEKGEQPFGGNAPLDATDIAGDWKGNNYRWSANAPPSLMSALTRNYDSTNSSSSMLVRLPLGISVVAPQSWSPGSSFSFGTGWLPSPNLRPVMIRGHSADGRIEKVDWRLETRLM